MRCWSVVRLKGFGYSIFIKVLLKENQECIDDFIVCCTLFFFSQFVCNYHYIRARKTGNLNEFKHYPTSINRRTLKSFSNSCGRTNVKLWQIVEDELTTLLHVKSWPKSRARRSLFCFLFSQNWREKIVVQQISPESKLNLNWWILSVNEPLFF